MSMAMVSDGDVDNINAFAKADRVQSSSVGGWVWVEYSFRRSQGYKNHYLRFSGYIIHLPSKERRFEIYTISRR